MPFYIVSPFTRGNRVFTERADHNSNILFVEEWLIARGYKEESVRTDQLSEWRRAHMSNLVNALDLDHVSSLEKSGYFDIDADFSLNYSLI